MKFMFDFPFQQRQRENLVEKLLKRLHSAEEKNWGRIAHCLAQLKYSTSFKVVQKLLDSENRKLYTGKLGLPQVWEAFETIIQDVDRLKQKRNDTNQQNEIEAWKKWLQEEHEKNVNDMGAKNRAKVAAEKNRQRGKKRVGDEL